MKVFVTGATGFVGNEVLRQLHEAGQAIRILVRDPERARHLAARYDAEIHAGDVTDRSSLTGSLKDVQAVIHLTGIISESGKSTFENIHVNGTRNMVAAAEEANVKRFVHMSALGTRPNAVSRYHRSKWAAEEILRHSSLDFTIFRPSIIYGPHDHFVNLFDGIARCSPILPVMGNGNNRLQPVPVEDVAACFVRALTKPESIGQTYDLAGRDIVSFNGLLDIILEVTHRKRGKIHLSMPLARFQATVMEWIFPTLLRKASPLNRDQLLMLQEDNVGDAGPANRLFGLSPICLREGIARYLA